MTQFPTYFNSLINLINMWAESTRSSTLGSMAKLTREYRLQDSDPSLERWKSWYLKRNPRAIDTATDKLVDKAAVVFATAFGQALRPKRELVKLWIEDLVFTKTYAGFQIQDRILEELARIMKLPSRTSTLKEESKGIDGYLGTVAVSIKPESYKTKQLSETIGVPIVFYKEQNGYLVLDATQLGFTDRIHMSEGDGIQELLHFEEESI